MIDFHGDWFHPDRMYLVVIGDFDSQEMVEQDRDGLRRLGKGHRAPAAGSRRSPTFPARSTWWTRTT